VRHQRGRKPHSSRGGLIGEVGKIGEATWEGKAGGAVT